MVGYRYAGTVAAYAPMKRGLKEPWDISYIHYQLLQPMPR